MRAASRRRYEVVTTVGATGEGEAVVEVGDLGPTARKAGFAARADQGTLLEQRAPVRRGSGFRKKVDRFELSFGMKTTSNRVRGIPATETGCGRPLN